MFSQKWLRNGSRNLYYIFEFWDFFLGVLENARLDLKHCMLRLVHFSRVSKAEVDPLMSWSYLMAVVLVVETVVADGDSVPDEMDTEVVVDDDDMAPAK